MDLQSLSYTDWALILSFLILVVYKIGTWNYNYFTLKGIKTYKTVPFLGSMACVTFRTKSFAWVTEDVCKFTSNKLVGFFLFREPILVVKDPELIKQITVKDFDYFMDHRQTNMRNTDPILTKNLFSLRGDRWREMRNTLSPAFTTSKLKNMFVFMNECGQQLEEYMQKEVNKRTPGEPWTVEMKDVFTRFTNDVIASSAFGISIDSLKEEDNSFYRMGKNITNFAGVRSLKFLMLFLCPKLVEWFDIRIFTKQEMNFFVDLVHKTISAREKHGIVRPDMIHLLMQARKGELKAEQGEEEVITNGMTKTKNIGLTEEDIVAQAMVFFFAGFDSAATLLAFTSILMAVHQDIQTKLQQEIDDTLAADSKLTYEKLQGMKYLDMIISETLRMYPPTSSTDRLCVKDYKVPANDQEPEYIIKKDQGIFIPIYGIHHNPDYYPEPEKFDPERFSDENKHNIKPYTYLPFGVGPRLCIGQRFVLLEAKVALVHILSQFNLVVVDKTPLPLRLSTKTLAMLIEGGFWMGVTPRQKTST